MKKLIAVATLVTGALTLAGCGGDTDEPSEAVIDAGAAESVLPETSPGTYTASTPDGIPVSVVLGADGTYTVTEGGEQVESGTWEDNMRGTCLVPEGGDGEDCYDIAPPDEDGMVAITAPDSETMTYSFEG